MSEINLLHSEKLIERAGSILDDFAVIESSSNAREFTILEQRCKNFIKELLEWLGEVEHEVAQFLENEKR